MTSSREWRNRLILLSMTVLLMLFAMEIGCRVLRGTWFLTHWPNLVLLEAEVHHKACMFVHDDTLGYVPEPACTGIEHGHSGNGLRAMPAAPADSPAGPPILVTGDSYAYSDEVKDNETWPAYLQDAIHRHVENGGVPGYGLDQTVLRTEKLARQLKPQLIVLAFIADDLQRAEMRRLFGTEKPYFTVANGKLDLHNSPVPDKPVARASLPFWQRWFGWSMLVDKFMRHFGYYATWFWQDAEGIPAGTGETLACPLMQRVADLRIPTLVVAQYRPHLWRYDKKWGDEQRRLSQIALRCAQSAGLQTYDSFKLVDDAVKSQGVQSLYGDWHHNAAGNHLVAEGISGELNRLRMLP
ncbi:MAG: hypothetical protein WCP68_04565 [Enhydrobacter sp.]